MAQTDSQYKSGDTGIDLIPKNRWGAETVFDAEVVRANLIGIQKDIVPYTPRIIGVTKYYGLNSIIKGYEAGLREFAESRAMDAIDKLNLLPDEIRGNSVFHFIGHLQTNKAEKVVKNFDWIQSVDSLKLARVISDSAVKAGKRINILLQVNNAGEEQKSGYSKEALISDLSEMLRLENLEIKGLMNIAPLGATEGELSRLFGDIREYSAELETKFGINLPELSMGMSNDYKIAVREGATMIRVGRKLFS